MEDQKQHFARPTMQRPPSLLNLTIIAALLGFIAGWGGYLLAQSILPATDIRYLNLDQGSSRINIDQPLVSLAQAEAKSVAGVYRPTAVASLLGQALFAEEDFLGSALVVTSDGWLMTTDQVLKNNQARIILADQIYEIKDTKSDAYSHLAFIKIEANFLSPVDFQLTDQIKSGERLFSNRDSAHSQEHDFYSSILINTHYNRDKYLSSDRVDYYLQVAERPDGIFWGAPYFNLEGALIGLGYQLEDDLVLLPAEYLKQAVKNLLNNTSRVQLGVYYVDMENNSGFERKGVMIYHPSLPAVVYNSPAAKAGLRQGDQLVAINNNVVSSSRSLNSILQSYRPGDKVVAKIFRNNQEQDVEIQL